MVRRGQFGRLPRASPSLTSEIISLAQQMQSEEDSNIMDAWKNGGTYNGKPVTDQMVIDHWKQRLAGVDPHDPLHDTYKNNVQQLQYQVAYSKKYTAYLKGGRTDNAGMASFFQEWSKKIPRNSEFYRTLQQDAAGYVNLARSAARAGAAQASQNAYVARRDGIIKQYIDPAAFLNGVVDNYAKANGLIGAGNTTTGNLSTQGVADLYDKLANADPGTLLYTTATGQHVTVDFVRRKLGNFSPELKFGITAEDLNRINQRGAKGAVMGSQLAKRHGSSTDQNYFTGQQADLAERAREDGTMSVEAKYWSLRDHYQTIVSDPSSSMEDKLAAWNQYKGNIGRLSLTTTDDNTKLRLQAEAAGDTTQNSLAEDAFGFAAPPGSRSGSSDIAVQQASVKLAEDQMQMAHDGTGIWTPGNVVPQQDGSLLFQPALNGTSMGLTSDPNEVAGLLGSGALLHLPSKWSPTGFKDVYVQGVPVELTGIGTGTSNNAAPSTVVAKAYVVTIDGQQHVSYQYRAADGKTYFTSTPPWSSVLPTTVSADGSKVTVDGSVLSQTGPMALRIAQQHPDFYQVTVGGKLVNSADITQNADGSYSIKNSAGTVVALDPGQLVQTVTTNPQALLFSTDPTRTTGPSITEDYRTLTQSTLDSTPGGQDVLRSLMQNPQFVQLFQAEIADATKTPEGYYDPNQSGAANLQLSLEGQPPTPQQTKLFDWFGYQGTVTTPAESDIAQQLAEHLQGRAAGTISKTTLPTVQGGHTPDTSSLATIGASATRYATLSRLGLIPPSLFLPKVAPVTPPIQVSGVIKVPAAPVQPPPVRLDEKTLAPTPVAPPPAPVAPPSYSGGASGGVRVQ